MKRLMLILFLAAPLGCSSVGGPWMPEVDKDPDLHTNLWPNEAESKAASDAASTTKK